MKRRLLPIGIQDFPTIRGDSYYYVDKTLLIRRLVSQGRYYFLSRPRRFGKSLLLDTLRELFAGSEPLFRGLAIHDVWDWNCAHPVVRLSFDGKYNEPGDLDSDVVNQIAWIAEDAGIELSPLASSGPERFRDILHRLHKASRRQVVVLVDEYDKPILDVLEHPELAKANRDYLRDLYGVIKGSARHVRFVFVTGITIFSKVSLFAGLNNLEDISLDPQYATLCGFTDREMDTVFAPELFGIDRDEIRARYNGYRWQAGEDVYNPFDVLLLFKKRVFRSWWFETGTPDFLYRLIVERGMNPMELEHRLIDAERLANFDVGDIDLRGLMFQAGYLTIGGEERVGSDTFYALEYPNLEVRRSFSKGFLSHLGQREAATEANALLVLLARLDFRGFGERLQAYLAGIPHQWRGAGQLGEYEAHYAAMLYLAFSAVGSDVRVEDATSRGRADMVVLHGGRVFVLEFKMAPDRAGVDAAVGRALSQMRERGYGEKYRARGEPIRLVAVVFGREERNLLAVEAEHC